MLKSLCRGLMRYIEVLDRRLGVCEGFSGCGVGPCLRSAGMLSAVAPFSIKYVDVCCARGFFAIMVDDVGTIDSTYHINADLYNNSSSIWNDEKGKLYQRPS